MSIICAWLNVPASSCAMRLGPLAEDDIKAIDYNGPNASPTISSRSSSQALQPTA